MHNNIDTELKKIMISIKIQINKVTVFCLVDAVQHFLLLFVCSNFLYDADC